MPRKPEQQLWDDLSRNMQGRWRAQRIENKVGHSIPDVYFDLRGPNGTVHGWMELKQIFRWNQYKSHVTKVSNLTHGQKTWLARNHRSENGNAWLLLHIRLTDEYIFLTGDKAGIVGDVTQEEIYINAYKSYHGMPHPLEIVKLLGSRGKQESEK